MLNPIQPVSGDTTPLEKVEGKESPLSIEIGKTAKNEQIPKDMPTHTEPQSEQIDVLVSALSDIPKASQLFYSLCKEAFIAFETIDGDG